jgi:hypothetical protein
MLELTWTEDPWITLKALFFFFNQRRNKGYKKIKTQEEIGCRAENKNYYETDKNKIKKNKKIVWSFVSWAKSRKIDRKRWLLKMGTKDNSIIPRGQSQMRTISQVFQLQMITDWLLTLIHEIYFRGNNTENEEKKTIIL